MELIILSLAVIKVLYPAIMLVITALFIAYIIKHRNNAAKVRQATQILFYLSTSMYYLNLTNLYFHFIKMHISSKYLANQYSVLFSLYIPIPLNIFH